MRPCTSIGSSKLTLCFVLQIQACPPTESWALQPRYLGAATARQAIDEWPLSFGAYGTVARNSGDYRMVMQPILLEVSLPEVAA